jgi:hypothetical protein
MHVARSTACMAPKAKAGPPQAALPMGALEGCTGPVARQACIKDGG